MSNRRVRAVAMRPRRVLVKVHRWLSIPLFAWLIVISLTGAWLVMSKPVESWLHPHRYDTTPGDVGPEAALQAAREAAPEGSHVYSLTLPSNGRGVYEAWAEVPRAGDPDAEPRYREYFVDPGSGEINGIARDEVGLTPWLYRGHMYLWQDHGIFGAFDPAEGWCRPDAAGNEPGGVHGVVCDVIPDGEDMVAWFAVGWIVVLLTGFYLWYWPGVRRWATALAIRRGRGRFAFHMSVHKVVGLVVWLPLLAVAVTGVAFAFPNMKAWYQNVTPAGRGMELWTPPDDAYTSGDAAGRPALDATETVELLETRYPTRAVRSIAPPEDETGTYSAWVSRGFDPWTREGGAGNTWVLVDQYSGTVVYDGSPEDGNVFDQAWDDWSFPVHTGDFLGTPSRLLWVLVGLSPLVLGTTGVTMNLIRRSKRAKRGGARRRHGIGGAGRGHRRGRDRRGRADRASTGLTNGPSGHGSNSGTPVP